MVDNDRDVNRLDKIPRPAKTPRPLKRSELKRSTRELRRVTPMKTRRSRIRPESEKRRAERELRAAVRRSVLARDRGCRAEYVTRDPQGRPLPCWGEIDVHEIITRGRGGDHLDPANCLALCRGHHDWAHHNIELAEQAGVIASLPPTAYTQGYRKSTDPMRKR